MHEREVVSDEEILEVTLDSEVMVGLNLMREMPWTSHLLKLLIFSSMKVYRETLRQYLIDKGIQVKYVKNDKEKVIVICKKKCTWRIHRSKFSSSLSFPIKSIRGVPHKCPQVLKNSTSSTKWIRNIWKNWLMIQIWAWMSLFGELEKNICWM